MLRTYGRAARRPVLIQLFAVALVLVSAADGYCGTGVSWQRDVAEAAQKAARENKPMLIMFSASWCGPCHRMLDETFANPALSARLARHFVTVLVDADAQTLLVEKLKIEAMPTLLVVNPDRKIVGRFMGFQSAADLDQRLASFVLQPISDSARSLVGRRSLKTSPEVSSKNPLQGRGR